MISLLLFLNSDDSSLVAAPPGFQSVLAKGSKSPDTAEDEVVEIDGKSISVPQSKPIRNTSNAEISSFSQDEFLVYNETQQRLRFILTFRY